MFNRPNQNDINDDAQDIRNDVSRLADTLEEVLKVAPQIADLAKIFTYAHNFIYLGRGYNYPTALEGALKLKEIGAPQPGALVSLCGWLDLTLTAASLDEPGMLPSPSRAELERNVASYAGGEDRHNPLLSPVFGALAGLPPLLLQSRSRPGSRLPPCTRPFRCIRL